MEKYKIYAKTVEDTALEQIKQLSNSILGENANIRIMPDCHSGKSCVIGTTMKINDKICPNIVGVDIGCGVTLIKTNIDFENNFMFLDNAIAKNIPFGKNAHDEKVFYDFSKLKCWDKLDERTKELSQHSLGSLGGGNHFIEAYKDGWLCVHSGSRNIGLKVATYYQLLAEKNMCKKLTKEEIENIEPKFRQEFIKNYNKSLTFPKELSYLVEEDMKDYLHDIKIIQEFAKENRKSILENIMKEYSNYNIEKEICSTHNYIDINSMILRKGAISAMLDELLVIPLNMRDGVLICKGKGNEDWNYSAPHGAGRLYSRTKAKENIKLEDFQESMKGIYTTCINKSTIDESPFAYKDFEEIIECIEPTVEIIERLKPIYNFKAN